MEADKNYYDEKWYELIHSILPPGEATDIAIEIFKELKDSDKAKDSRIKELEEALKESLMMLEQTFSFRENNGLTSGNIFLTSTIDKAKALLSPSKEKE